MTDAVVKVVEATSGTNLAAVTFTNALGDTVKATEVTLVSEAGVNISPLTDTQLRATAVPVSGTVTVNGTVGISGNVEVVNDVGNPLPVSGTVTANAGSGTFGVQLASGIGTTVATPAFITWSLGGAAASATNPAPVQLSQGNASLSIANPLPVRLPPLDQGVVAVGAAGAAVTLTLPAVAGQFHYIDAIEITLYNSAARTGAAAQVTVTSTNIPGAQTFIFGTAGAIGTYERYQLSANNRIKSSAANTATTIVCPAVTGGIWHVRALYYTGA